MPRSNKQQPVNTPPKSNGRATSSTVSVNTKSRYGKKANGKNATGRQSKYDASRHPDSAYKLCAQLGAEDTHLAAAFQISTVTLNAWKNEHEDFLNALKKGKADWDNQTVVSALRRRAQGYSYTEVTEKSIQYVLRTGNRKAGKEKITAPGIETTTAHKQMAPDVTACIFWLVNRQPEMWKHVARTIVQGDPKNPVKHSHEHNVEGMAIVDDPSRAAEVKAILKASGAFDVIAGNDPSAQTH